MLVTIPFQDLPLADLVIDAIYEGGAFRNSKDDPFTKLLGLSNMGGFRYRGDIDGKIDLLMILSTFSDADWPDNLDKETGVFTYFGDNKTPGRQLHETGKRGNRVLARIFKDAYGSKSDRLCVPPTFIFARRGKGRNVAFLGLAVPGVSDVWQSEDLAALWRTADGQRFQNYRARFSILNEAVIPRTWINSLIAGNEIESLAPISWREWRKTGRRKNLKSERSVEWRSKIEQYPQDQEGRNLLLEITSYFRNRPHDFEFCAAEIARLTMPQITLLEVTRASKDGGRDAVGKFRIGSGASSILVDFALEAKCLNPPSSVGVRYLSRLISRLRHREFGILVTTTWLDQQAYQEIKEDGHPIAVIAGADIVQALREAGLGAIHDLRQWLEIHFPVGLSRSLF